ncbi:hypothetical protein [Ekhidna sp.]
MRTSLAETLQIENWLLNRGKKEERLLIDAKLVIDEQLFEKVNLQREAYDLIKLHGRQKLRGEIKEVERELFTGKKNFLFQDRIHSIFTK